MVNIDGKLYRGSITLINGKVMVPNGQNKKQRVEQKISKDIEDIDSIVIDLACDQISISNVLSDTNQLGITCYGEAISDEKIKLNAVIEDRTLQLFLTPANYIGLLQLSISIPHFKYLKTISVKNSCGDILCFLAKDSPVGAINLQTKTGNISGNSVSAKLNISADCGNISYTITAERNIDVDLHTITGSIYAQLKNLSSIQVFPSTVTGIFRYYQPRSKAGYRAIIRVSSTTGNILLR